MRCKKVQTYIPSLRTGSLSDRVRTRLERHLAECETCREWLLTWERMCDLSLEVSLPPQELDWESFHQAMEAELQRHHAPGHRRLITGNVWRYLTVDLWSFIRRAPLRIVLTGAAAGFVLFMSSHLQFFTQPMQEADNLIIGSYLTSSMRDGVVLYNEGEANRVYYHQVINLATIEGKD